MSQYAPLEQRLVNASAASVTLTFSEIERVLGRKLPKSAYNERIKRQWWANTDSHSQARAWLKAGRKAKLNAGANEVTFVRDDSVVSVVGGIADDPRLTQDARRLIKEAADAAGVSDNDAIVFALNEAARAKKRAILDWFEQHSRPSTSSSVDLIREDRDGR